MFSIYAPSMSMLVWASARWSFADLHVISYNEQIEKFCGNVNISFTRIKINKDKSRKGLKEHKDYIIEFAKALKNNKVFFGHNSHDYWGLFLMDYLDQIGYEVFYTPCNLGYKYNPNLISLLKKDRRRYLIDVLILRNITGYRFHILSSGNYLFIGKKESDIISKYNKLDLNISQNIFENNRANVKKAYNLDHCSIVLVDQGEAFYKYTDEVINILISNDVKQYMYIKQHPGLPTRNHQLLESLKEIPREIPIQFVTDSNTTLLGIASAALKEINNSISILKLVKISDSNYNIYKRFLQEENIHFPETNDELKDLLRQIIN
jgi:hypothetical protein